MAAIVQLINEPLIIVLIRGLCWTLRPWMSTEGEQMDSPYVGEVLNSLSLSCSLYFSLSHTDTNSAHENVCGGTCERVGFSFFLFISFSLLISYFYLVLPTFHSLSFLLKFSFPSFILSPFPLSFFLLLLFCFLSFHFYQSLLFFLPFFASYVSVCHSFHYFM